MKEWKDITHYAGFDWARDHHAVVIVDSHGQIVADFEYEHSLEGWKRFQEQTAAWPNLAIAIETNQEAAVDQLLQRGSAVYPVNPAASESYRKRKAPSGTKTDRVDGWALADALRVDGHGWKILQPMDPLTQQLRLLCRDEVTLIEQRTALVNELQQALVEYYPAALEAFDDWTSPSTWDFIIEFATPQALVGAGKRRWEKFLHTHKLWRPEALSVCKLLRTLQEQLDEYRKQIEALFQSHHALQHLVGLVDALWARKAPPGKRRSNSGKVGCSKTKAARVLEQAKAELERSLDIEKASKEIAYLENNLERMNTFFIDRAASHAARNDPLKMAA